MSLAHSAPARMRCLMTLAAALAVAAATPAVASAHRTAPRTARICVTRGGSLRLRERGCRRGEGRLDLTRATRASASRAAIETCVTRSGAVRIVAKRTRCKRGERRLAWAAEGKPGAKGETERKVKPAPRAKGRKEPPARWRARSLNRPPV